MLWPCSSCPFNVIGQWSPVHLFIVWWCSIDPCWLVYYAWLMLPYSLSGFTVIDVASFIALIYGDWLMLPCSLNRSILIDFTSFIVLIYCDWLMLPCSLCWFIVMDVGCFVVVIYDWCWLFHCGDLFWLSSAAQFIVLLWLTSAALFIALICVDWSWLTNTALCIALICVDLSWLTNAALFIALINCNWVLLCYWFTVWWWTLKQPTQWGLTWRPSRRMRTVSSPATVSVTTGTRRGGHRVVSVVQCQKWEGTVLFELRSECLKTSGLEVCFISI